MSDAPKKLSDIEKTDDKGKENDAQNSGASDKPKKKGLTLPSLKKNKKSAEDLQKDKNSDKVKKQNDTVVEPLSPSDIVNQLDGDIKVLPESPVEALSNKLDTEIEAVSKDIVVIKVTKNNFLKFFGVIVVIVWIVPFIEFAKPKISKVSIDELFTKKQNTIDIEPINLSSESSPSEASMSATPFARIKDGSSGSDEVKEIATLLEENGFEYVEIIEDTNLESTGLTLISKDSDREIFESTKILLEASYTVSTASAVLSEDSDFSMILEYNPQ